MNITSHGDILLKKLLLYATIWCIMVYINIKRSRNAFFDEVFTKNGINFVLAHRFCVTANVFVV